MASNALKLLQTEYRSDSESEDKSDNEIDVSSDSSSSEWSLSSDEESKDAAEDHDKMQKCNVKTKGEVTVDDLPPIEKLSLRVGVEELSHIGNVVSIVDQLLIIQSNRGMPALDLDSVLFLADGQSLGQIFDVFGPVIEPRYAIRWDSSDLKIGTPVYFAPQQQQPITGFVFVEQLRRLKGSDASWKHNNEPPEEVQEFSDDESERLHKMRLKAKRKITR